MTWAPKESDMNEHLRQTYGVDQTVIFEIFPSLSYSHSFPTPGSESYVISGEFFLKFFGQWFFYFLIFPESILYFYES